MFGFLSTIALFIKQISLLVSYVKNNAFPQPLSEEEELKHLTQMAEGNAHSRNMLIEHNLRLVAHIVKKLYTLNKVRKIMKQWYVLHQDLSCLNTKMGAPSRGR